MKQMMSLLLAAVLMLSLVGCSADKQEDDPTADVLATFAEITKVPRPSHHEQQISDWLKDWASAQGFAVQQDKANNLIIEVPATEGMEEKPLVALQGHMDMVFVSNNGSDPMETEIKIENDGTSLTSDGTTSLGADDGIGLALMMNIAEGKMDHGPLRLIITTNEEDGMSGAFALDPQIFSDIPYLINLDSEDEGCICLSTAASIVESCSKATSSRPASLSSALRIELDGFRGGHSGVDINLGRLNAILTLSEMLGFLDETGIDYEIASLSGGTAANAIPTAAEAVICISGENTENVRTLLLDRFEELAGEHEDTDPNMSISVEACEVPGKVLDGDSKTFILGFLKNITNGVVTMSADVEDLVESSANPGLLTADENGFSATVLVRSSSPAQLEKILNHDESLCAELGIDYASEKTADPWPYNPDNRLAAVADEVYQECFGTELVHQTLHAGLECGTFAVDNPGLEMIALGPDLKEVHSVNETLEIASIAKVWTLLEGILAEI